MKQTCQNVHHFRGSKNDRQFVSLCLLVELSLCPLVDDESDCESFVVVSESEEDTSDDEGATEVTSQVPIDDIAVEGTDKGEICSTTLLPPLLLPPLLLTKKCSH